MGPISVGPPHQKETFPIGQLNLMFMQEDFLFSQGAGTKVSEVIGSVHALYQLAAFPFLQCLLLL